MSSQTERSNYILQRLASISLLIYPVVAHLGVLMDQVMIPVFYLMVVIYINSLKLFSQHKIILIALTFLMCILLYVIIYTNLHAVIIYLPPVLIPSWLAFIFLGSLTTKSSLITRMAERIEGDSLDNRHLLYTRYLTAFWGVVFLVMIAEAITLSIWAPFKVWSWWVHVGNYIIIAVIFLVEIMVRHHFTGQRAKFFQMLKVLLQREWREQ